METEKKGKIYKGLYRPKVGDKAQVICSTGFHSRSFIGQTGTTVMRLDSTPGVIRWVIRFSSSMSVNEEGLFDQREIMWV